MSKFTLMQCDITTGAYTDILPDFTKLGVNFEMSDVGSLAIEYPRGGVRFSNLTADTRCELAVLLDGVEMDDARFRIQSTSGDEIQLDQTVTFNAVSLLNRFKKAIVYPPDGSTTVSTPQTFISATPGGILKALFDQNAARGTGRVCDELTYTSFSATLDSAGNPWVSSYGNITYEVGVNYLDIIRNMFDSGMIEVKMVGRDVRVYNADGLGTDRTVITEPVVLRRGVDYQEASQTRTNEQIAAVALIAGDNDVLRQEVDSSVATAWGADETFLSQGGISDSTTLGVVAQASLDRISEVRAERTRKIVVGAGKFTAYTDYRCSDYIFNETGGGLERLRIRQMVLEMDQDQILTASVVLNDKFLEQEVALARKVNGILGGAISGGPSANPTPSPETDTTTPNAPASLSASSAIVVQDDGRAVAQASLAWPAVTQNTDSSTISDLDHYETQWHSDAASTATPAPGLNPARDFEEYTRKFDRRGKGYGWLGADGGCSCKTDDSKTFWAFADTNVGSADQEGRVTQWSFPHNTWVITDPTNTSTFEQHWGYGNRLSDNDAFLKTTVGNWQSEANCSVARSTSTFYYGTASLQITATAAGDATARLPTGASAPVTVTAGNTYSFFCRARSVGTARQVAVGIRWYDNSNALLGTVTSSNFAGSNSAWTRYVVQAVAPANAVRASAFIIFRSAGAAQVFNADVFQICKGDARYFGWNDPERGYGDNPCAVMNPEELGGAELTDLNDIFWVDSCFTVLGKIYVFYTRYTPLGVFKNSVCLGTYDATTHEFLSLDVFTTGDTFIWGTAYYDEGNSWLYVYGTDNSLSGGNRGTHIMQVPRANILGGTKLYWNGTIFQSTRASSTAIYTGYSAQFGSVVLIAGTFYSIIAEYGGTTLKYLTSPAVTGTWTMQGSFYTIPEIGSGLVAYFPRIHKHLETNAGIPVSYSVNGSVNGDNSLDNIRYYAPKFAIGPPSTLDPISPVTAWSESRIIPSGTLVDYIGGIPPYQNFEARVRAVDSSGHASGWRTSTPIRTAQDTTAPNRPSAPIVSSAFQGIRIEWDGLDYQGGPMPGDWSYTEVHVSEVANFQPGPLTKVDVIRTRGGGVFPYQGLIYGRTYYVRFIAVDSRGNRSDPSDASSALPEQLVNTAEIAEKLITGAKIADQTIFARSLTVAALEESIVPNGNMEEDSTDGSGVSLGVPYGWTNSGWTWGAGGTIATESTSPIGGAKSMKITMAAATDGVIIRSVKFPVVEGKLIAFSARFKTSRAIATSNVVQIQLATGVSETDAGSFPGANSTWSTAVTSSGTGAVQTIEGSQIVPASHKYATVFLLSYQAGDGSGYNVLWDDVLVQPVGGSAFIADASILNAKIANLAVDNAKIANMSIGKLTAGILAADMTVSARIKTSDTGARVELNSAGFQAYNSSGTQVVGISSSTGSAFFTGNLFTGISGSRVTIQPGGDFPLSTIYFYPTTGTNYAWINSPEDGSTTTIGVNTGTFTSAAQTVRQRLWLSGTNGIWLHQYRISDGATWGGEFYIGGTQSFWGLGQGTIVIDNPGGVTSITINSDSDTGSVNLTTTGDMNAYGGWGATARVGLHEGSNENVWYWDSAGIINHYGRWTNFVDSGSTQGLFTGSVGASAGTSWTVSYGTTRASASLPIVTPDWTSTGASVGWSVNGSSTTSFTVKSTNTISGAIRFWCFRV